MMIIVLGIGGVLGWVAHRAHVQRDAVAAITTPRRNTRGSVYYDWQFAAAQVRQERQAARAEMAARRPRPRRVRHGGHRHD